MSEDNVVQQGDVQPPIINLYTSQHGSPIDLSGVWTHLSVYENMKRNYIEGEITVTDAQDVLTSLPILLGDRISIEFKTPSASSSYKFDGRIVQIPTRKQAVQGAQVYVLRFISNEFVSSQKIQFSKSYNQMLISDMIANIFDQYVGGKTKKKIRIVPTLNSTSCVVPMQSPFRAINWLSKWAISPKYRDGMSYVFFENRDGYYFGPIEALIDQNENPNPVATYGRNITVTDMTNIKQAFDTITDFDAKSQDHLDNIVSGMYASRVETHDLVTRSIGSSSYNYFDHYDKTAHLGDENAGKLHNDINLGSFGDSYIHYAPKHHEAYPLQDPTRTSETTLIRKSQFLQYYNNVVEVTVPGDSDRTIGEVVRLNLLNASPNLEGSTENTDKYLSGRYLITALRHIMTRSAGQNSYMLRMGLSKDSYQTPLPEKLVDPWR